MDKAFKERWIEALRSGRYRKAQCALKTTDDAFDCLGVICDLYNPKGWHGGKYMMDSTSAETSIMEVSYGFLPGRLMSQLGLKWEEVRLVSDMNDTGSSFEEIAAWIEENL